MSLAKRFFDGFLGKRDKDEEKPEVAVPPPPKTAKVAPPPPKVTRAGSDEARPPVHDRRNESQTFQVSTPRPPTAEPTVAADADAIAIPLLRDDLRRSQTIRVSPPPRLAVPAEGGGAVDERPGLRRVALRLPDDGVRLPFRALLPNLPPALRGPAWTPASPEGVLIVDREHLRRQLAEGQVSIMADEARRYLPDGWLDENALGELDLDLAEVLAAVPAGLIAESPAPPAAEPARPVPVVAVAPAASPAPAVAAVDQPAAPPAEITAAGEVAELPYATILDALPSALRGPAWRAEAMPEGTVPLARAGLLAQLSAGRVAVDIAAVAAELPDGWLAAGAAGEVELDLSAVVSALPVEWLQASAEVDHDVVAVQAMSDMFTPAARPPPAPAVPVPPVAAVAPAPTELPPQNLVDLPAELVLSALPVAMRGPAWRPEWPAAAVVRVPCDQIKQQLAAGRVELTADQVRSQLPADTCAPTATGTVLLDLAAVVSVVPAELLQVDPELDQEAAAAAAMKDLFASTAAAKPAPSATVPADSLEQAPAAPVSTVIVLPCSALLSMLPVAMRGPAWRADAFPEVSVSLPKDDVLAQLAAGSVKAPIAVLVDRIPAGWLTADASGTVELDLADVVAAVPAELMGVSGDLADDVVASSRLGTMFMPASLTLPAPVTPVAATAPTVAAVAAVAPVVPEPVAVAAPVVPEPVAVAAPVVPEPVAAVDPAVPEPVAAAAPAVPEPVAAVAPVVPEPVAVAAPAAPEPVAVGAPVLPEPVAAVAPVAPEPVAAVPAAVATVEPEAALAAVPEPHYTVRPTPLSSPDAEDLDALEGGLLPEWSGVEPSLERAPLGINLNTARAAELMQLAGIGDTRAQAILEHRATHGHFRSIYELAELPGIGPTVFRRITGLSVRRRVDRHQIMEQFISLPANGRPLLERIVEALRSEFGATGALLTNVEGLPLAVAGEMKDATKYAALGSRYFFRTRRHLQKFVDKASDCIILPGSTPPLLLLSSENVVVILALTGSAIAQKRLTRVRRAMREVGWLLSRRAVVLGM